MLLPMFLSSCVHRTLIFLASIFLFQTLTIHASYLTHHSPPFLSIINCLYPLLPFTTIASFLQMEKLCDFVTILLLFLGLLLCHGGTVTPFKSQDDQRNGDMYKSNPKHTCSGGFTEVTTELKIPPIHGQSFSGCREDLSWDWKFSRGWASGHQFEATEFHMVEKNRSPLCGQSSWNEVKLYGG